ncbi:hypothetical protein BJ138DRAFT_1130755 [Hygrophoropsis aurantiaca]|uniref:Uncharacterized protein n=1 Tax=Hygrophoropsis aurantiaca TaxID=72124 RepID=A0ACB7ZVC6_9AGAM|nr:hypothetical protein BJ138DRAFT_1130755 [Hygrophoropsis aurantiaca]
MTKPFLRDGKPTNARPPPPLDTGLQKLCQCRLCISSTALSPKFLETREATQGQWLDERTFQRHQREENLLRAVEKAGMDGPQYTALLRKPVESDLIARRRAPHKPPARPVVPPAGNPNSTQRQEIEVGEGALAPVIASGTVVSARNMDRGAGRGGEAVGGGAGDAGARRSERKKAVDDLTTSVEESKTDLQHICSNINSRVLSFYPPRRLVFARQPMIDTPFLRRPLEQLSEINRGQFALHPGDPANAPILALENDLVRWLGDIDAIPSFGNSAIVAQRRDLSDRIFRELDRMDDFKEQEWERQRRGGASTGDARMKADLVLKQDDRNLFQSTLPNMEPRRSVVPPRAALDASTVRAISSI